MEALSSVREMAELAALEASLRDQKRLAMRVKGQESWYVTRPGRLFKEDRTQRLFDEFEIDYYNPKIRKMAPIPRDRLTIKQRRSGLAYKEAKLVPLLPAYRFVRFDRRRQDWRDIFTEAHIHGMIFAEGAGEYVPMMIRYVEIEKMKRLEIDGAIPQAMPVREWAFKVGEQVRIVETAYAGFPGIIKELPEKAIGDVDEDVIFKITVWLFGRPNLVELPLSAITKL